MILKQVYLPVMYFFILALACIFSCTGTRPPNIGVKDCRLSPCPSSPNCVSSQAKDDKHFIKPIGYKGNQYNAMDKLKSVIGSMKRAKIIFSNDNYIYAEFTSAIFRFVDDVEFLFNDADKVIDVRSASRMGYGDMGVNRKRIEKVRELFSSAEQNKL